MGKVMSVVLRFGPLLAALALGLQAAIEPFVPGYTGAVNAILGALGLAGVVPDKDVIAGIGDMVAATLALVGVARKFYSLAKAKIAGQ